MTGSYRAYVTATEAGIVAGLEFVDPETLVWPAGEWRILVEEGQAVSAGERLVEVIGSPPELATAEDHVLGALGFASGIATAARAFVDAAPPGLRIVCGGWKKLPFALKPVLRAGLAAAGVSPRLLDTDFVYTDKNALKLFGSIEKVVRAGLAVGHGGVSIQVKNAADAVVAAKAGATAIMVDTGRIEDLATARRDLIEHGLRPRVTLAFSGGVRIQDLPQIRAVGADAVDIGRAILEAPLLDLRFDVDVSEAAR
jgi:nicotinate-nucleotide pyrophosphorylase (carboxylating)